MWLTVSASHPCNITLTAPHTAASSTGPVPTRCRCLQTRQMRKRRRRQIIAVKEAGCGGGCRGGLRPTATGGNPGELHHGRGYAIRSQLLQTTSQHQNAPSLSTSSHQNTYRERWNCLCRGHVPPIRHGVANVARAHSACACAVCVPYALLFPISMPTRNIPPTFLHAFDT